MNKHSNNKPINKDDNTMRIRQPIKRNIHAFIENRSYSLNIQLPGNYDDYACPVSEMMMFDPVIAYPCGHSLERFFVDWQDPIKNEGQIGEHVLCNCGKKIEHIESNTQLKNEINQFLRGTQNKLQQDISNNPDNDYNVRCQKIITLIDSFLEFGNLSILLKRYYLIKFKRMSEEADRSHYRLMLETSTGPNHSDSFFMRFKKWIIRSGIRYDFYDNEIFNNTEMMYLLNPFSVIIENDEYPYSKIYRQSFSENLGDTFEILTGDHYDNCLKGNGRLGILDLFIIPIIGQRLVAYSFNTNNVFLGIVLNIIGLILEIPRILGGYILTIAFSPIVATVNVFSYFKAKSLYNKVRHLKVRKAEKVLNDVKSSIIIFPKENRLWEIIDIFDGNDHAGNYILMQRPHSPTSIGLYYSPSEVDIYLKRKRINGYENDESTLIADIEVNEENMAGIQAIMKLNLFNASNIRKKDLEIKLKYPELARNKTISGISEMPNASKKLADNKYIMGIIYTYAGIANYKQQSIADAASKQILPDQKTKIITENTRLLSSKSNYYGSAAITSGCIFNNDNLEIKHDIGYNDPRNLDHPKTKI